MDRYILKGTIITPFKKLEDRAVFVKEGRIEKVVTRGEYNNYPEKYFKGYRIIETGNNYISPGFIDIHSHGANDADAVKDSVEPMAEFKIRHGTTAFFPTLWTAEFDRMIAACKRISNFMKNQKSGARVMGINSEGPYLNPKLGAQKKELVRNPDPSDYKRLMDSAEGNIRIMTVAPELNGAFGLIKYLRAEGVVVSFGHTDISIPDMHRALDLGITLVTHLFNAMGDSVLYDRGTPPLGIQQELLVRDGLMCEILCDSKGIHIKPTLIKIALACKGYENIILITDSMNMSGFPPGTYQLQDGRNAVLEKGSDILRLENGDLAGSVMTMDKTVKNIIKHTGCSLEQAVRMASNNPATVMGLSHRKGEIKEGMDADIIVFDEEIDVKMVMVEGSIEYEEL